MPRISQDLEPRRQQFESSGSLAALPVATLARRRRILRFGGFFTLLLAIGLSVVPGPKGSSETIELVTERGITSQVRRFTFSRRIGIPFSPGKVSYAEDGSIENVSFSGEGILGNLGVAFALVVGASIFMGRRRRDD
jgi:hypothetical protein